MPSNPETTLTLDLIEQHLSWLTARGRSENTVRAYGSDLRLFLAAQPGTTVGTVEANAQTWLNQHRRTWGPKTTGRRLTSLRTFARWAGLTDALSDYTAPTPARSVPHPLPEGIDGVLRMIGAAKNQQQVALVALCGLVGLRVAEALAVQPGDIDYHEMTLSVRGKGDKTRIVPVSDKAWLHLAPAVGSAVMNGRPTVVGYQDRFARECLTAMAARAGLKRAVSSHDLRATFATAAYNACSDPLVVRDLLGHSSVETTQVYIGVGMASMRAAAGGVA